MECGPEILPDISKDNASLGEAAVSEAGPSEESLPPSEGGSDEVYPRRGCGETLEEGKAFELGE